MTIPAYNLTIDLEPSRRLLILQWAAHGAAAASLLLLDISLLWLVFGWFLVGFHGLWMWRKTAWSRQLRQLSYREGRYVLVTEQGQELEATGSNHYVMPRLTILCLVCNGRRHYLPLLKDSADPASLRRLRVLLRCRAV